MPFVCIIFLHAGRMPVSIGHLFMQLWSLFLHAIGMSFLTWYYFSCSCVICMSFLTCKYNACFTYRWHIFRYMILSCRFLYAFCMSFFTCSFHTRSQMQILVRIFLLGIACLFSTRNGDFIYIFLFSYTQSRWQVYIPSVSVMYLFLYN